MPHSKLKGRLKKLVKLCFMTKYDQRRYTYRVLERDKAYRYLKKKQHYDSSKMYLLKQLVEIIKVWTPSKPV